MPLCCIRIIPTFAVQMKIALHIFTFYIFALSLFPCGDEGGGIVEITYQFLEVEHIDSSDHQEHSKDCGDDTCSPFCICSCCASALDAPAKLPCLTNSIPLLAKTIPSFLRNEVSFAFIHSIWQPPTFS